MIKENPPKRAKRAKKRKATVKKEKKWQSGRCARYLVGWDSFGQPFNYLMPDGEDSFKTLPGAIISLIVVFVVVVYAGLKLFAVT